tara:strand:- start:2 stop:343 length:342 start_codon:yes stop_codon:yes gene_type:complete
LIAHRARVGVITDICIVYIHAPYLVVALIVGAWISIVAHNGLGDCACPILARLNSAKTSVITGTIYGGVGASCVSPTCVFGAWISIVAIQGHFPGADTLFAYIANGAWIAVVA